MTKPLSKSLKERRNSLLKGGIPKFVRIYDNGGIMAPNGSLDRYTISFTRKSELRHFFYIAASENPYHPQGFGQHMSNRNFPIDRPNGTKITKFLGKKIQFKDLPKDVKRMVKDDYMDLWNLKVKPVQF
jgi:hypothetical protein